MMRRFDNRVVVITGGAQGIGRACADRFASEGARIAILDINLDAAEATARELGGMAARCDVADERSVSDAIAAVLDRWGRVDVLVANAGIYRAAPLTELQLKDWQLVIDIDLTGVMLACRGVAPVMMGQRGGSIVIQSSMAGKTSWPATAAYSAAKSGALGLMRSIAQELGAYNVNCNAVCLGHADTDMLRAVDAQVCAEEGWQPGTFLKDMAEQNPMKRLCSMEEVAALTAFLTSDEARYINGQSIEIDGGLLMS